MMGFKINVHIIFAVNMCYDYHRAEQICSMQRFNSVFILVLMKVFILVLMKGLT